MNRILILVYESYERDSRVRRHCRALVADGHAVEVLALGGNSAGQAAEVDGVRLTVLEARKYRGTSQRAYVLAYLRFTLRALLAIRKRVHRREADLIYVNNPPDFLVFAALPARLRGIPIVLDVHDMTSELYGAKFGHAWGRSSMARAVTLVERLSYRFADAMITVHDLYAERIRGIVGPRRRVSVIWNLNDHDEWLAIGDARLSSSASAKEGPLRLGHHGTIVERFGADIAVEAVARLRAAGRNVTLSILGDGDFADSLAAKIEELGVQDAVYFDRRAFTTEELPRFVSGIDVGVAPYRSSDFIRRSLPVKVLEYLALGVPPIVTETEPISRLIDPAAVRTLHRADAAELSAAVEELADSATRERYRRAGRRAARELRWAEQAETLRMTIREALRRRH